MAAASSDLQNTRTDVRDRFRSNLATVLQRAENRITRSQFDLNDAKTLVTSLRTAVQQHGIEGVPDIEKEMMLLSQVFTRVHALVHGHSTNQQERSDPRQVLVYGLCALAVFPSSMELIVRRTELFYTFSTREAAQWYSQLDTLIQSCRAETDSEGPHDAQRFLTHQRLVLDLASWLERDRPTIAYLMTSKGFSHVRIILEYLSRYVVNPDVKGSVLTLRRLLSAADVLQTCILVRKGFLDQTESKTLRAVDAFSLFSAYAARHAFAQASVLYHRGRYAAALRIASNGLQACTSEERTEMEDLISKVTEARRESERRMEEAHLASPPDPEWLEGTNAYTTEAGRRRQEEVRENHRNKPRRVRQHFLVSPVYLELTLNILYRHLSNFFSPSPRSFLAAPPRPAASFLREDEGDEEMGKSWFEKSEEAVENGEVDADTGEGIELSDRARERIEKGGRKAEFYKDLTTDLDFLHNLLQMDPDKYKHCQLKIESSHRSTAKVLQNGSKFSEIKILGRSRCGRTYMDDEVVVAVLKEPGQEQGLQMGGEAPAEGDQGAVEHMAHGEVIGLLKRVNFANVDHPVLFCTLDEIEGHLMKPLCKTVPKINVRHDPKKYSTLGKLRIEIMKITPKGDVEPVKLFTVDPGSRDLYVFKVAILGWNKGNIYPKGAVLEAYLGGRNYSSGLEVLYMQQRVPRLYPQSVVDNTNELLQETDLQDKNRLDLTGRRLFTIDPPNSRDLDDALSVWKREDLTIVGVHIADVAAVVKEGSAIDKEARKRAVTFYPLDRKPHPMLPEPLSHGRCSLLPGKQRLALSVFFTFDENGEQVDDPYVRKTTIKSSRQFTYQEVQSIIDDTSMEENEALHEDILQLNSIARTLREGRYNKSMLFVPFEDPRLPFCEKLSESTDAHSLVEEFMILTNAYIAKHLRSKFPKLMILRCHQAPTWEQLAEWQEKEGGVANLTMRLQGKNVTPDTTLSYTRENPDNLYQRRDVIVQAELWISLRRHLENGEWEEARRLAFMDDLHPLQCLTNNHWMELMETAQYKCSYGLNQPDHFHFGLDIAYYTHFTSPIRRYADLHVHRLLHAHLEGKTPSCNPEDITRLCQQINGATARQKAFGKGCLSLKIADSLQRQPLVFRTFVDQVDSEQLTLMVPSLRAVSDRKQELPFSILGVTSQPEVTKDTAQNRDTVSVKWNKRIYNKLETVPGDHLIKRKALERETLSEQNDRSKPKAPCLVMDINPYHHCVHLSHDNWSQILAKLVETDGQPWCDAPVPVERNKVEFDDMTSERGDDTVSLLPCHFRMQFSSGQILQVQMSAEPRRGVLKSRVDLVHTARNASVCTRHVGDPILTLSSFATQATKKEHFTNYRDYLRAWMPLLEMEAAYGAGGSDGGFVVEKVALKVKHDNAESANSARFRGSFVLEPKFCFDRCIEFGGESPDSIKEEESKGNGRFPLDYVCIRYRMPCPDTVASRVTASAVPEAVDRHYTWVGHAGIVDVQRMESKDKNATRTERNLTYAELLKGNRKKKKKVADGPIQISIVLSPSSPPPPQQLLQKDGAEVTLEILPKSEVDRRAQEYLTILPMDKEQRLKLAQAIAYGKSIPKLDEDHLRLGMNADNREVIAPKLPRNNAPQRRAIQTALTKSLSLIQGPPGTGKTYTGIKLVYLFCKINRQLEAEGKGKKTVLFCGPSNKSVDLVAKLLKLRLGAKCPNIVRMYGSTIESKDYPIPRANMKSSRSMRDLKSDPELTDIALHHIIRQSGKPHAEEICQYEEHFERCRREPKKYPLESEDIKAYRKLLYEATVEELGNYEVVLTTCAVGGNRKLIEGTMGSVFQVIIDECAMSPEPHSLVPIIATKARQVVLIGDHKQLRPIITCQAAADLGLDQSLFERLYEQYPANTVFLDTQYRMHPQICEFPSQQFYNGKLQTKFSYGTNTDLPEPLPFWPCHPVTDEEVPHILVDVRGEEETLTVSTDEGNEKSKSNVLEADKVMEILSFLKSYGVELQYIKVLTQYNAQRHLLEERMKQLAEERTLNFNRYDQHKSKHNASTVVSSQ
ncbi:hypothetical protein BaRGS_00018231, partial [Batillaria attramentaria]